MGDPEGLPAILREIREEASNAFLSSGGDPARMAAAYEKVRAAETIEAALQIRMEAETFEQKKEKQREQ